MLVDSTIFLTPDGGRLNTVLCSLVEISEWRGIILTDSGDTRRFSILLTSDMSPQPGRNTRIAPSCMSTIITEISTAAGT